MSVSGAHVTSNFKCSAVATIATKAAPCAHGWVHAPLCTAPVAFVVPAHSQHVVSQHELVTAGVRMLGLGRLKLGEGGGCAQCEGCQHGKARRATPTPPRSMRDSLARGLTPNSDPRSDLGVSSRTNRSIAPSLHGASDRGVGGGKGTHMHPLPVLPMPSEGLQPPPPPRCCRAARYSS